MDQVGAYFFTNHSLSDTVRGWADPSQLDSIAYPHDSQIIEDGRGGNSTPHNESFQPLVSTYFNSANVITTESSRHGQISMNATLSNSHREGASPTSSPGGKPARPLFMCTVCHKSFTEKRYRTRHYREKHQPGSNCWYHPDCDHKWFRSRSYKYREHLKDEHGVENDDIDEILGGPSRRRRRRDKVESDLPPHLSLLPIEHDRKSPAESQQRPLMFSLVEGKYARHASPTPPLMPAVAYNTRPGHAEPAIATTEHEYSSALLSEEEFALLVRYLDIHIHNQILFPSVRSVSGDSVADPQTLIYTPVAEYHRIRSIPSQPQMDAASTLTNTSSWLGPVGDSEPYRCASPSLITDSLLQRLRTATSYA